MDTKELKEHLVSLWRKTGYMRKELGPKAYSQASILEWVKSDLGGGYYIEAYAIADQYIETLIRQLFDDGTKEYWDRNFSVETSFRCSLSLGKIKKDFLDEYLDFKKIRNDLVHNAIFNRNEYKRLKNLKKVKKLPSRIILGVELFFEEGMKECFKNLKYLFRSGEKEKINLIKKKMDYLADFKIRLLTQRRKISNKNTLASEIGNYFKKIYN